MCSIMAYCGKSAAFDWERFQEGDVYKRQAEGKADEFDIFLLHILYDLLLGIFHRRLLFNWQHTFVGRDWRCQA